MRILLLSTAVSLIILSETLVVSLVYHAAGVRTESIAHLVAFMATYLVPFHLLYFAPFLGTGLLKKQQKFNGGQDKQKTSSKDVPNRIAEISIQEWAVMASGWLFLLAGASGALWFILTDYGDRYPLHLLILMKLGAGILSSVGFILCFAIFWQMLKYTLQQSSESDEPKDLTQGKERHD